MNVFKNTSIILCMLLFSITASAQQYWSGTKTYGINSTTTISSNIVLTGDVTLIIQVGAKVTISGVISGPYSITMTATTSGLGNLYLTNNNTYTGGTIITKGHLYLGNNTPNGSVTGNINVSSGTLRFKRTTNWTYSGVISGSGNVYQESQTHSVTLNGVNTYTSETHTEGKLILGASGSIENSSKVVLENYATAELDISAGNKKIKGLNSASNTNYPNTKVTLGSRTLTIDGGGEFGGVISGTGGIIKTGTGTLVLEGANTYTGTTNINAGKLSIGANGTIANSYSVGFGYGSTTARLDVSAGNKTIKNLSSNFTNTEVVLGNKTLTINAYVYSGFAGIISGTGNIIKTGTDVLILGGNNTYTGTTTIQSGTLYIGNGGGVGSVAGNIVNNGELYFNRTNAYTYEGVISGTGHVYNSGTGNTTFTSNHTYTGGTTIQSGTLTLGNNTANGNVTGNILNIGKLVFNRSNNFTYSGVISGMGSVTKTGTGVLRFTTSHTYTGGTTISQGTLYLGNNTTNGSVVGNIVNNATLCFWKSGSGPTIYDGVISGTGAVIKYGDNSLYFTGNNTYTGTTTIDEGKLYVGSGGTTGAVAGNIVNNGSLVFYRSNDYTYSGVISGAGTVGQTGSAVVYFTGNNTYTGVTTIYGACTLSLGNNTTTGSVAGNIVNNGTLAFHRSNAYTYEGVISGNGKVTKSGAAALYFTGNHTYTGGTTINNGSLYLGNNTANGSVTGNIVNNGSLHFVTTGSVVFQGIISGTGSVYHMSSVTTLTLTKANTYTGSTYIQNKLILDASGSIANSNNVFLSSIFTKLDISSGNKTIKNLNSTVAAAEVVLGSRTLTIGTSGQSDGGGEFAGIISGTGTVTKTGTGTLTLSGQNNTATGTFTQQSGTVVLSGKWAGAYNKQSGATLTVTGNPTIGGNLTLAGGDINMNLTATEPSKLTVTGAVSASGTNTLNITTNPIADYVLIAAASGIGSTTPYTVNSTLHTHLSATGTQLILNAATTPLVPAITTATLPDGLVGSSYSATLVATGITPITWSLVSGNLPNGLSLSSAGVISGTCSTQGTFNFTVKVTNIAGEDTKALTITVSITIVAPVITTTTLPTGIVGTAYSATLEASGTAPTWTIESGSLPAGLTFNATTGVISGTPTTEGSTFFVVKAANSAGSDIKALEIEVSTGDVAPTIVTTTLPDGTVSAAYNTTLAASGTTPITWSIESGNLPDGLTLSTNGAISGTPTTVGTSTFTVIAANGAGADSKELTITILTNEVAPVIITTTLPDGAIGTEYSQTLAATGSTPIIWTIESGDLPNGLILNADGVISGTPTAEGTFTFTVKATNNVGSDNKEFKIRIESVGIEETLRATSVKVYPNPTNGELTIENGQLKIENIDIYDIMGKKIIVNSQLSIINSINIAHLPSGIYFIKISTEAGTVTKKVIKN